MKKSDRARFLDKTPYLVISGGNVGKNQPFYFSFEISALVLAAIGTDFFFLLIFRRIQGPKATYVNAGTFFNLSILPIPDLNP